MASTNVELSKRQIDDYDFSFVYEKISNEKILAGEDLGKIEREFKRFLKLVLFEDGPLAMIDRRVDELWHAFILFTPQYQRFCESIMGFFVHHQPRTSMTPVPIGAIKNFVEAYEKHYGSLDSFWLERLEPEISTQIMAGNVSDSLTFKWSGWTGKKAFF